MPKELYRGAHRRRQNEDDDDDDEEEEEEEEEDVVVVVVTFLWLSYASNTFHARCACVGVAKVIVALPA